ncbi:MAG: hypothetical protein SO314_07410, partial [Alphaproteobacteria bacterium]|nr:hypothetical protein [Alphaproteobacteria bacterium]
IRAALTDVHQLVRAVLNALPARQHPSALMEAIRAALTDVHQLVRAVLNALPARQHPPPALMEAIRAALTDVHQLVRAVLNALPARQHPSALMEAIRAALTDVNQLVHAVLNVQAANPVRLNLQALVPELLRVHIPVVMVVAEQQLVAEQRSETAVVHNVAELNSSNIRIPDYIINVWLLARCLVRNIKKFVVVKYY